MTTEERQEFLAERKTGVGGSDCASLWNMGYGCRRRLWYDKSGVEPDYLHDTSDAMELGNVLEPFFRRKYAEKTGRQVFETGRKFGTYRHPYIPSILVHLDGVISATDKEEKGALEIKSCSNRVWWEVKRNGLPVDYVLQLQHGFTATYGEWGAYSIGNRDSGRVLYWDVERDEKVCANIEREVPLFWATVGDWDAIPARLEDPEDGRCQRCDWRLTCRGEEFVQIQADKKRDIPEDESLRPLRATYLERKGLQSEVEDLVDEAKAELQAALGEREEVLVAGKPIYFRQQQRESVDTKTLMIVHAQLLERIRQLEPDGELARLPGPGAYKKFSAPFRTLRVY